MPNYPTLKNAPIQEGLIDLRTLFEHPPTEREFKAIADELHSEYPESSSLQGFSAQFQLSEAGLSQQSTAQYRGLLLQSAEKTYVFQAQVDGFTISRLRPYTNWGDLLTEAKRLWAIYEKHTGPIAVKRVAIRFVNCFDLPEPIASLDEFFQAPPKLPDKLPQHLSNYLIRYQIPDPDTGATILLTQSMDEVAENRKQFIVDIDAFKDAEFLVKTQEWWQLLGQLRDIKNRVFFASLTPLTLERFK
jgi:uncharacterized protein (TIGR04255 family)